MAAATCQGQVGTGGTVSWANAEGGLVFSREDSATGITPIPIPTATGTNYSWLKNLVLAVTVAGTTAITNRRVSMTGAPATGLILVWKAVAVAAYAQAANGNRPNAAVTNGAVPSGYTLMTTSPVQYDNTSVSTAATGPNGSMVVLVLGVDNTFTGGANNATALPSLTINYDEA